MSSRNNGPHNRPGSTKDNWDRCRYPWSSLRRRGPMASIASTDIEVLTDKGKAPCQPGFQ